MEGFCGNFSCGECMDCLHFSMAGLEAEGIALKKIANDACCELLSIGNDKAEMFSEQLKKYDHIEGK